MTYVNLAFDELGASVVFEVFEQGGRNVLVAYNRSRQNPLPTPEGEGVLIAFPDSLQPETVNAEHHKQSARGFTISVRTVGGGILVTNASATLDGLRGINTAYGIQNPIIQILPRHGLLPTQKRCHRWILTRRRLPL